MQTNRKDSEFEMEARSRNWTMWPFAVIFILVGVIGLLISSFEFYPIVKSILRDLSIAALAAGTVSIVTERVLVDKTKREVAEAVRKDLTEELEPVKKGLESASKELQGVATGIEKTSTGIGELVTSGLSIVRGAEYASILAILPPRGRTRIPGFPEPSFKTVEWSRAIEAEIASLYEAPENIVRIAGRSVRDFFLDTPAALKPLVEKQFTRDMNVYYRILVINPYSREGQLIASAEGAPNALVDEAPRSIAKILMLWSERQQKQSFKIDAKVYSCGALCEMVATSRCVFIEQYHLGSWPGASPGCTGGLVPSFQYGQTNNPNKVKVYEILISHFDRVWSNAGPTIAEIEAAVGRLSPKARPPEAEKTTERIKEFLKIEANKLCTIP